MSHFISHSFYSDWMPLTDIRFKQLMDNYLKRLSFLIIRKGIIGALEVTLQMRDFYYHYGG